LEHIHISVDPVSARNPGYCFVDFNDRETADRALSGLKASINGRPVKVGPCQPKKQNKPRWFNEDDPVNKRWGDWSSKNGNYVSTDQTQRGPNWALDHFEDMVDNLGGRRLYVGGLDMMVNQALHNTEMTELFAEFCPYVSEPHSPCCNKL
jgi:RNA recognition motif-containing protein